MAKKQKPGNGKNGNSDEKKSESSNSPENIVTIVEKGVSHTFDLDKPSDFSPEDIKKLSEAFTRVFAAEIQKQEPANYIDPDEFQPEATDKVAEAIKKYSDAENVNLMVSQSAEQNKIAMLFHPKKLVEANSAYRAMVKEGHYRFVGNENVFDKHRVYKGKLARDSIESLLRRVDAEVRNMDPLSREELLFNFINAILSSDLATNHSTIVSTDQFSLVSPDSQELLRDLVLLYMDVRDHVRATLKGYDKVNKDFTLKTLHELVELSAVKTEDYPVRVEYGHITRSIRPKDYYHVLQLIRALNAALPARAQNVVEDAVHNSENVSLDTSALGSRFFNPSKYLRKALIAISRGYGSFETFFTELFDFQQALERDLNNNIAAARCLVAVYDSLGLDIATVLKTSSRRILDELPF